MTLGEKLSFVYGWFTNRVHNVNNGDTALCHQFMREIVTSDYPSMRANINPNAMVKFDLPNNYGSIDHEAIMAERHRRDKELQKKEVTISYIPGSKLQHMKEVRDLSGCSLIHAKDMVESSIDEMRKLRREYIATRLADIITQYCGPVIDYTTALGVASDVKDILANRWGQLLDWEKTQ